MCRFAAYMGPEITISSLVTEPKHSLIHQSYNAKERIEPLNGDGFGVGWYAPQFLMAPALFKDVSPAWSNMNLFDIARVTQSSCIFAHVRAATIGGELSRTNCHPFAWKNYLFMHNGTIFGFEKIQRTLRKTLSDTAYALLQGSTDSEHVFALFVDNIKDNTTPSLEDLGDALKSAIGTVEEIKRKVGITTPSTLNLVLTNGGNMVATRYISSGIESNSLYYTTAERYYCQDGKCHIKEGNQAFLVVSEPLDDLNSWERVENNQMLLVGENNEVRQVHLNI